MGRCVQLLDDEIGVKVSVRAGPEEDRVQFICPESVHEWSPEQARRVAKALSEAADLAQAQAKEDDEEEQEEPLEPLDDPDDLWDDPDDPDCGPDDDEPGGPADYPSD